MSQEVLKEARKRMEKVEADLRAELGTLRTGRASVTLLDHVKVDYYGTPTPIRGKVIRVPIPALTDERRKEMVKHLHKVLEGHRTAVRNIRRDLVESFRKMLKDKKMSEDDER